MRFLTLLYCNCWYFCLLTNKVDIIIQGVEDKKEKESGESENQRMARVCVPAMNSINEDLEFTVETEDDFTDKKLLT